MITHNLGYPRIGSQRELKKACELYWSGKSTLRNLVQVGKNIRQENWLLQQQAGISLIPSNDFSFYDQVLDMSLMVGAIPERYHEVMLQKNNSELDLYFAMARGYQKDGNDITAMEMTKWFDTNYHYIVPEFHAQQSFKLFSTKVIDDFYEAKQLGIGTKPVLIGPVSYLLLGKEKETGFHRIDLIKNLLPVYLEMLKKLDKLDVQWIQFDEPFLVMDLTEKERAAFRDVYATIRKEFPSLKIIIATYFDELGDNLSLATSLPVCTLHIDLVRAPHQLDDVIKALPGEMSLSLGIIDGRNIWKNDFTKSLGIIEQAIAKLGTKRVMIAPSCSLLHTPCDLDLETNTETLPEEIKNWMSFAKQKIQELSILNQLALPEGYTRNIAALKSNQLAIENRRTSSLIHRHDVKARVKALTADDKARTSPFEARQKKQQRAFALPLFPTTSIGSFPQTDEVRQWRAKYKKGLLTKNTYEDLIRNETEKAVKWQETIGLDVFVHGEFERNDMVEYFGEQLDGYAFHCKRLGSKLWIALRETSGDLWRCITPRTDDRVLDKLRTIINR